MSKQQIDPQALVRMGKGQAVQIKPVKCNAWLGAQHVSDPPFDAAQVKENRRLYPHLFTGR